MEKIELMLKLIEAQEKIIELQEEIARLNKPIFLAKTPQHIDIEYLKRKEND